MSDLTGAGELILPGVRWNAAAGRYDCQGGTFDEVLALGVGGFCFFGGTAEATASLIAELRERSKVPLLIAADLERGAGQQFAGLTGLPPLAALGSLGDAEVMRRAGRVSARESASIGVNWIFAPVLDLDIERDNPIIGTRAIGGDPDAVAALGAAWIEGCQAEGVLACAKHFPGHGRTTADSHATLPVVDAPKDTLVRSDLAPFRAAVAADVAAIMSAHVAYPALDPSGDPATLSRPILRGLLRLEMGFGGLIVSDALIMEGVHGRSAEMSMAARALNAGVDLLLYPKDVAALHADLASSLEQGSVSAEHLRQSRERRTAAAARATMSGAVEESDREWASRIAVEVVRVIRGAPAVDRAIDVAIVDDDHGGPYAAPSREPFMEGLRAAGFDVRAVTDGAPATSRSQLVALFGDIRAWKGRPGYSVAALERVASLVERSPDALVLQFSHPRLAADLRGSNVVCAWGGEAAMQRAAAEWLGRPR